VATIHSGLGTHNGYKPASKSKASSTPKPSVRFSVYHFRPKEKDPVIDQMHTFMDDHDYSIGDVSNRSGLSATTLYNWFDGPTRCPQHRTVAAFYRAIGYEMALVKATANYNGKNFKAAPPRVIK